MIPMRKLNHMAAGLLGSFVSRNNDIQGYWALGVLYTDAQGSGKRVELDLLSGSAQPATPVCTGLARGWEHRLRQAISALDISMDDLASATVSVEFDRRDIALGPNDFGIGEPFLCSLRLSSKDGRVSLRTIPGRCRPHDQFFGSRSTRYRG